MPWNLPIPILTGFDNPITDWVITENQTDLNLYLYTGQQPEVLEYNITVAAGVDINTMLVEGFPSGCILNFTLLGRIRGRGGRGGHGNWAQGEPEGGDGSGWTTGLGILATGGENALVLQPGITFRLDLDEGHIWGGGGGGRGGGSIVNNGGFGAGGGGGGGGRGWNNSPGGPGGEASGEFSYSGLAGADGSSGGGGAGGDGGFTGDTQGGKGGTGGDWGMIGGSDGYIQFSSYADGADRATPAGSPGVPGKAIDLIGVTLQFVGSKSEATLISEGRIRGQIS